MSRIVELDRVSIWLLLALVLVMAGSLPVQAQLQRWGTVSKAQQRGLSERQGAVVDDLLVADNSAGQDSTKSSGQAKSAQPKEHKDPAVILTEALLPQPHKYWHPPIVHFPIAFFVLEALLLAVFLFKPTQFAENASRWLLWLALISVPAVGITGVHDAGVDLGGTNAILDGISDRIHNFTHFDDALSVHVLFIDVFLLLSICRLAWRLYLDKSRNFVSQKIGFSIVTFIGLWILLAAAQAGGSMSHQ